MRHVMSNTGTDTTLTQRQSDCACGEKQPDAEPDSDDSESQSDQGRKSESFPTFEVGWNEANELKDVVDDLRT